jgi:hypothetical protein
LTSREVPDSHSFADVVKLPRDDCALQVSELTVDPIGGTTRDATGRSILHNRTVLGYATKMEKLRPLQTRR